MAEVDVTIGGRSYRLACDDGQEAHLRKLSARLDAEARSFAGAAAQIPESRLLLMSALMVADQLDETETEIAALRAGAAAPQPPQPATGQSSLFADAGVEDALERIEETTIRIRALSDVPNDVEPALDTPQEAAERASDFDVDLPEETSLFDDDPSEAEIDANSNAEANADDKGMTRFERRAARRAARDAAASRDPNAS